MQVPERVQNRGRMMINRKVTGNGPSWTNVATKLTRCTTVIVDEAEAPAALFTRPGFPKSTKTKLS